MIVHLFNSSSVSGPERLVLPALASARTPCVIVNLLEDRIGRLHKTDPLHDYAQALNLDYHTILVRRRWDRKAIGELHQLLRHLHPDLVHAHAIKASVYLLLTRRKNEHPCFPIISTHHGVHGLPDWKVRLYEFLYRRYVLKNFDRALAVSSTDYEFLLRSGLNSKQLRCHLNGIDGRRADPKHRSEEARKVQALWLPQELQGYRPFLFGVIARLSPEKDHDRMLRVLSCLNQLPCNRDWKCLIFGSGALEATLRQQAVHLGLEKRVLWMGYRKDVADELAGLDLLLSFSKAEGLPINLIEAGWAGTPVMGTRVGGVIDLIPDESYGHSIAPEEPAEVSALSLLRALSREGHTELEVQARRFQERVAREFSQKKWLQKLQGFYSELGVAFDGKASTAVPQNSLVRDAPSAMGAGVRSMVLLFFVILSQAGLVRAEIPQPPVLLLTAKDNGTESQSTFACSGPIHGYITLPEKAVGKHILEGIWTGPHGKVIQHSRNEVIFPASGRRTAEIWLQFTQEHLFRNPFSVQDPGDADRALYDGTWNVVLRWDDRLIAQSAFQIRCL